MCKIDRGKMSFTVDTIYNDEHKIWYGPKSIASLFHPDCSVGRVLFHMMKLKPKAVALHSDTDDVSITYEQLLTDSIRIAQHLKKLTLNQDDIIGIISDHSTYFTHIVLGCWFNALTIHPVYSSHEQAVVNHIFNITRPKIIFCEGKYYKKAVSANTELKLNATIYTINDHIENVPKLTDLLEPTETEQFYTPEELVQGGAQTVCILNSSGTSGLPKAVCMSNHMMFDYARFDSNDVTIAFSPLDWIACILFYTINTILAGAKRIITTKPCTPEYLLHLIKKYKITNVLLSPLICARLLNTTAFEKFDFSNIRVLFVGGSIMSPKIFQSMRKLLKDEKRQEFCNIYGTTEFGGCFSINYDVAKPGSAGKIKIGFKAKIIDDDGKQLGIGETGELLLHRENSWNGYYNNPDETLEMYDAEGWFHTGDLGQFDSDGYLFIKDRQKDIMKYHGVQYSPNEIEEAIAELPDVLEVCVFGNTNETDGDRAAAAIVRRVGSNLTASDVIQYVANKYEVEWKRLNGGIFFVDSLPKTGSNKLIRRMIRDEALNNICTKGIK